MHMADALISPAVGGALWAGSALSASYAIRKMRYDLEDKKVPLMGVMGAFVFAAQMINFTIPGTGSSGHIGGGMLLSILLGPYAGFLTMASVLLIQALFFADGGLLSFGCNLFNMGVYTCFVAYPLIYQTITKNNKSKKRLALASVISVVVALQLGAFSVVLETLLSGKTELPFNTFIMFMQPVHLAIGLIEGLLTAAVVVFLRDARPSLIIGSDDETGKNMSYKKVLAIFIVAVLLIGGIVSWFASSNPDGLEWSIEKITGSTELKTADNINKSLGKIQEKTTILPDYQLKSNGRGSNPVVKRTGASLSGIAGSIMTLGLTAVIALCIAFFKKRREPNSR